MSAAEDLGVLPAVLEGPGEGPPRPLFGVRTRRVEGAPIVALRVWLAGGSRLEEIPGQGLLTGRLIAEGSRRRDWKQIVDEAEDLGMVLASFGTFESHGVAVDALAADWERALEWAAELILEPSFPADRCDWLARQTAAELESMADQPEVLAAWGFLDQLYSPHPRGRPIQGTAESLLRLTPADCAAFHARALAGGVRISVAGVIDEEAVAARAQQLFGSLSASAIAGTAGGPPAEPPPPSGLSAPRREVATDAEDQAHLFVGHLTVPRRHPDYTALELVAVVLGSGSGFTGRIPQRIREREGLAYSANAQTVAGSGIDPGRLVAYVGTAPDTVEQAERGVREEIARLVEDGVLEEELEEARAYLLGREPFRRETARQWAELMGDAEHYGLPIDDPEQRRRSLESLDREAVDAAARRHLDPAALKVTVGLPE